MTFLCRKPATVISAPEIQEKNPPGGGIFLSTPITRVFRHLTRAQFRSHNHAKKAALEISEIVSRLDILPECAYVQQFPGFSNFCTATDLLSHS